ncbi:sialate O-acetylesterase [Flavobacterium sp. HXWNR69]|uniref:Sialate O-acetylesterase n=1 Tax=Flavobacterium fragile TaxID=2949085 RepID=A0ABT0TGS0_9FLAO|nr:sialate O-acetylesterase [Flavobacterium sp. HXWNR69]MCL9770057.1 sialate O-acetylesterase [Flavobacterium sp. HXWNR69]
MKLKYSLIVLLLSTVITNAQTSLASIFSDNMVLQRNTKIPVWGYDKPNTTVTVKFHHQVKKVKASKDGKWTIYLNNENAGGPYTLSVKGSHSIEIKNVLVGEVWICSGQSNMEWSVGQSDNSKEEILKANFPTIRHIKIPKQINSVPNTDFKDAFWQICSPETVADFTGVGYYFAKELTQKLNIPIGLINATWGGTNIETWISREGFENSNEFKEMIAQMPKVNIDSLLESKMIVAKKDIETLQKSKFTTDNVPFYKDLNFDDSQWLTLNQPQPWEEQILGNFDGVVWLRKHFTLNEKPKSVALEIPAIDDNDETFVNGIRVGKTNGWDAKRSYLIPTEILNIGDNVIAVRVTDTGAGGGMHGQSKSLKIVTDKEEIPLSGLWKFQVESILNNVNQNEFPSLCYNAMIHPLIPFAFKGVIWYQGESNEQRAYQYKKAFPLLIEDWRSKFKSDFPFYFVQLASFVTKGNSNEGCAWAELREAQTQTLKLKNTGMAVSTDLVVNPFDIHPTNKQDVGKRLAAISLHNTYNQKSVCFSGPTFKSFRNSDGKTILTFENLGSGLMTKDKYGYIKGFEVAGEDKVFHYAKAEIVYDNVVITSNKVANPIAVRFGWMGDASECNLFNNEGFPAVPFRTDDWKLSTESEKYKIN